MKVTTAIRSKVLSLAHQLCKTANLDFSTAQKKAWAVIRLKAAMQESAAVSFAYVKKSTGELRPAVGTTNAAHVPATLGTGKEKPATIVTYFDLTAAGWRSFDAANIALAA